MRHGQGAVVGQQQPVVRADVLPHGIGQLAGGGGAVVSDRNAPEGRDDLGQDGPVERDPGNGEPGGGRRVRVHDRLDLRPVLVDRQMHEDLGRRLPIPGQLAPAEGRW